MRNTGKRNAKQDGCLTGGLQDRKDPGKIGCWTGGIQDRRDAG